MDLVTFRSQYPEFQTGTDELVQGFLDAAEKRIDADIWTIHTDQGHGLLTAHLLCLAPNGQFARLQEDNGQTTYGAEYEKLVYQVACGLRVF